MMVKAAGGPTRRSPGVLFQAPYASVNTITIAFGSRAKHNNELIALGGRRDGNECAYIAYL